MRNSKRKIIRNVARKVLSGLFSQRFLQFNTASASLFKINASLLKVALYYYGDYLDMDDWRGTQLERLRQLLIHAEKHVVYWHSIFQKANFSTHELATLSDIQRLPIVTRSDIKNASQKDLIAGNIPAYRRIPAATSGSTGEPLSFYQDARELLMRYIAVLEELRYIGAELKSPILILGLPHHRYLDRLGYRIFGLDLEDESRRTRLYALLKNERPTVLIGATPLIQRLAHFFAQDPRRFLFHKVLYRGEYLNERERSHLRDILGGELFSSYGTRECSMIALQCLSGNSHLVPWINYIEIVDKFGKHVPQGAEGRIIVTYFWNEVTPFIRYDIGDRGIIYGGHCPCGRKTPIIKFTGRASLGMIDLPKGRQRSVLGVINSITQDFHREIARFQLEQAGEKVFIFRLVPTSHYSAKTRDALFRYFNALFNNEVTCRIEETREILPNNEGKTPLFIRRS